MMARMIEYMNMESCRAEISAPEVGLSVRNTADSLAGAREEKGTCEHGEDPIDAGDFVEQSGHQDKLGAILEVEEAEKMLDPVCQPLVPRRREE